MIRAILAALFDRLIPRARLEPPAPAPAPAEEVVHMLRRGEPVCGFAPGSAWRDWPDGHTWVTRVEPELVTCEPCLQTWADGI